MTHKPLRIRFASKKTPLTTTPLKHQTQNRKHNFFTKEWSIMADLQDTTCKPNERPVEMIFQGHFADNQLK